MLHIHLRPQKVAAKLRHGVELVGCKFDLLVFQQAAYQLSARVFSFLPFSYLFWGQQHA